jgi:hypothetical protein|tara:strand:- start:639 stop:1028 length:390 start_codon:yes stop_codon:yes gene_type:complete
MQGAPLLTTLQSREAQETRLVAVAVVQLMLTLTTAVAAPLVLGQLARVMRGQRTTIQQAVTPVCATPPGLCATPIAIQPHFARQGIQALVVVLVELLVEKMAVLACNRLSLGAQRITRVVVHQKQFVWT